jgi:hypothetical protein
MANYFFPSSATRDFNTPTEYLDNPFFGGVYSPANKELLDQASKFGEDQALSSGVKTAQDIANKVESDAKEKERQAREEEKTRRLNILLDLFRTKSAKEKMAEGEIKKQEREAISKQKMQQMAQDDAEYRAKDFMRKMEGWRNESNAPSTLTELGKDYFGRPIMTNRPASTAEEQARRIEAYNQAPGSLSQWAMASPKEKSQMATNNAIQTINKALDKRERTAQAAENGWAWDSSVGRYTRSNELTSSQRAAMRERLKLGPSFTFGDNKSTQIPAPASTTVPLNPTPETPKPASAPVAPLIRETITPASAEMATNEPIEDVVQPYTQAQKQPVFPVEVPTYTSADAYTNRATPPSPSSEVDNLLASVGISGDTLQPISPKQGAGRKGYTQADKDKADLVQAEANFKRLSTTRFGRNQQIDKKALRKAAENLVALRGKLGIRPGVEANNQTMYTGRKD